MENLMMWSLLWNDDFLEFLGIKFETNQCNLQVIKSKNLSKPPDNKVLITDLFFYIDLDARRSMRYMGFYK